MVSQIFRCIVMIKIVASIIATADWLGQQDETLVQCYEKRLKLWGVL